MGKLINDIVWSWGASRRSFSEGDDFGGLLHLSAVFFSLALLCHKAAFVIHDQKPKAGEGD